MISAVREWLTAIIAVSAAVSVTERLSPQGALRQILSATGGLVLLLTILQPLVTLDLSELSLDLDSYQETIAARTDELRSEQTAALSAGIADETAAYIRDKAAELGLSCTVQVTVEPDENGIPCPAAVSLDCTYNEALSSYIENMLDIAKENQSWETNG